MKPFTTALLAGAFALASTTAFAQAGADAPRSATPGAAHSGAVGGSMHLSSSSAANADIRGRKIATGADASGNALFRLDRNETTNGGSDASGKVK